jgi:Integral membrane protein TerC family
MVTRVGGRRVATSLFIVFIAISSTDLLFALDSIPAVFGVTEEAYIVFAANAFALLGLRALYFLVTGLLDRLVYLSTGLSMILAFIGLKLLLHFGHLQNDAIPEVQTSTSLGVIVAILAVTVAASLLRARRDPDARAHAGSLRDMRQDASTSPREPRHHAPSGGDGGEYTRGCIARGAACGHAGDMLESLFRDGARWSHATL